MNETTEDVRKYTAADLQARLAEYHSGGEWALQWEVGNGTGSNLRRHADAVAMSIWPSRGYKIHGYEIKVSRSDWLRELKEPEKADPVAQFCDAWFLVAPADIVNEVEVPETWGWMVPSGKSLRIKKQPTVKKVEQLTRPFVAAMLRRSHEAQNSLVAAQVRKLRAEDEKANRDRVERELKNRSYEYENLKRQIAEFEEQSGIKLDRYGGGNIGKKVKMLSALGESQWDGIPALISSLRQTLRSIEAAHKEFIGETET